MEKRPEHGIKRLTLTTMIYYIYTKLLLWLYMHFQYTQTMLDIRQGLKPSKRAAHEQEHQELVHVRASMNCTYCHFLQTLEVTCNQYMLPLTY
jgi:hypothetical protein